MKGLDVQEFYDQEATRYDNSRWTTDSGHGVDTVQRRIVRELLGGVEGKNVLEVGVGTGRFSLDLSNVGAAVTGVDISRRMLQETGRKLSKHGRRISRIQASATDLPLESSTFDAAICINVLSHLPDHEGALKEIGRVVRPGGVFVVNFPNLLSLYMPYGLAVNLTMNSLRRGVYTQWYTPMRMKKALTAAGLRVDRGLGQVHDPFTNRRLPTGDIFGAIDRFLRGSPLNAACPIQFYRTVRV